MTSALLAVVGLACGHQFQGRSAELQLGLRSAAADPPSDRASAFRVSVGHRAAPPLRRLRGGSLPLVVKYLELCKVYRVRPHPSVLTALRRGDLLVYDNYMPHRSTQNRARTSRGTLFAVFSPAAAGDLRTAYYDAEREGRRNQAAGALGEAQAVDAGHARRDRARGGGRAGGGAQRKHARVARVRDIPQKLTGGE